VPKGPSPYSHGTGVAPQASDLRATRAPDVAHPWTPAGPGSYFSEADY
jgi:hypothetical protein